MKNDGESATKNYSRPLVPRSALIIREHYKNTFAENEGSDLNGMFVIRNRQSKTKPFGHQYLIQEATRLINQVGISYSTINAMTKEDRSFAAARKILLNTYKRCILEYCRMNEDIGTAIFLLGQSFKTDTTSSSYTSFTAPEAERRLYSIMRILVEDRPLKKKKEVIPRDGIQTYNFGPERTTAFTGVNGKMNLPKGCELVIKCPHGVQGYVKAVEE